MGSVHSFPEIVDMACCARGCSRNATTAFKRYRDKTVIGECQFVVLSFLLTTGLKRRIRRKTAYHQYQKFYSSDRYSISHASIYRTLQDQPLCPCHIESLQELHFQDAHSDSGSCDSRWKTLRLQQRFYVLTNLASPRLGSSTFTTSIYGQLKTLTPFDLIIIGRQFSISLWARSLDDCLIGPHVLPTHICGRDFLNFPWTHLSELSVDVSFNTWLRVWFQHDSPPPRCRRGVRKWLSENHSGLWISRENEASVPWPARSPPRLTWIHSIISAGGGGWVDIWKPKSVPIQSVVQRNCDVEFSNLQME
jgi:hypothetical protein